MKTGIMVGDLMTRDFIWVSPSANLKTCAKTMIKKRVGSLIIKEGDKLKGILTEKDIIWALLKKSVKDLEKIQAKAIARRKVITIKPSVDVTDALRKMRKKKVRKLPVIEKGKVIGMITQSDILRIDPGLFELIAESVKIKEESEKLKRGEKIKAPSKQGICEECGNREMLYKDDNGWLCEACYNNK